MNSHSVEFSKGTSSITHNEKLWPLRRKLRVNVPADDLECIIPEENSKKRLSATHSSHQPGVTFMSDRYSKGHIERFSHLLQQFDGNNQGRLGVVRSANRLLESARRVSRLQEAQRGKDIAASASLQSALLVAGSHLEAFMSPSTPMWTDRQQGDEFASDPWEGKVGQEDDDFTSRAWEGCEDIAMEDLFDYFADALEAHTDAKTAISKTGVKDLLSVCWQLEESHTCRQEKLVEGAPIHARSELDDLDITLVGAMGIAISAHSIQARSSARLPRVPDLDGLDLDDKRDRDSIASTISSISSSTISTLTSASYSPVTSLVSIASTLTVNPFASTEEYS